MKILVIGGSSFVGRAIARAVLEAGHEVAVFNRGLTPTDLPGEVTRLVGDRQSNLSALDGLSFDATIDAIAYQRRDVEMLHQVLGERAGYYLQISSISAYQNPARDGADESTPLLELGDSDPNAPVTAATYGVLKAECERAAEELFGPQIGIVRPTYVIGAHDKTMRFPYWVARLQRGGRVAFPGPAQNSLQWIDARDLGEFTLRLTEQAFAGAVNAIGISPALCFHETLERIAAQVSPEGTTLEELTAPPHVDSTWYQKFPLWSGTETSTVMNMSNAKAVSLGLTTRSLEASVDDTLSWFGDRQWPAHWLGPAEETTLLDR
jgi:2'-hydroxyisoflavone reductase